MNQIVRLERPALSVNDWADRIATTWRQSLEAIIATGALISQAKAALPHGEFLGLINMHLPFGPRHAQRLMAIAADGRITNATTMSYLPPHIAPLYEMTKLDDKEFDARILDGTINPEMDSKAITSILKRERRADRERDLATKITAFPDEKFGVIYADPPWKLKAWSEETGLDRAADDHYPTMTVEDICDFRDGVGRHVSDIVAPDAVLFLWITVPFLDRMNEVLRAWGPITSYDPEYGPIRTPWKYVSNFCWDKEFPGTGRWNRNQHEHLLIARVGDVPAPPELDASIYREAAREHSRKPEYFAALIEQHFYNTPKIELFRRGPARLGWSAWGNQAIARAA